MKPTDKPPTEAQLLKTKVQQVQAQIDLLIKSMTTANMETTYQQINPLTIKLKAMQGKSFA